MSRAAIQVLMDDAPILRERSAEVVEFGDDLARLVDSMSYAMLTHPRRGVGLAAVQIGMPVRVIIALDTDRRQVIALVNPVVTRTLNREAVDREGCLSIEPMHWRDVSRPAKCDVEWQDLTGAKHAKTFTGALARIVQHEIDHLDGVLITDKPLVLA